MSRSAVVATLVSVLLAILANYALGVFIHASGAMAPVADVRARVDAHARDPWAETFYEELGRTRQGYDGFLQWRREEFRGSLVNISADGIRHTEDLGNDPALRVFFFGGSVMWGTGQRDAGTIPSRFDALAEADGHSVRAVNFGESAYTAWQEYLLLAELCVAGNVPDLCVFLDGVNDVFVQCQSPSPRPTPMNAERMRTLIEQRHLLVRYSGMHYIARWVRARLLRRPPPVQHLIYDERVPQLASRIYVEAVRHVHDLADRYGFETLHFWQPSVYTKSPLAGDENAHTERFGEALGRMCLEAGALARAQVPVRDLSSVAFGNDPVYVDWCHVNESGASTLAQAIYAEARPILEAIPATGP